jgi:Zn-dependent protease
MSDWWLYTSYQNGGAAMVVSWIFWVILSITLHELAHGWAALWQGDDTPRRLGHMTANPIVHMGPMSLIMFGLVGIAWGLMPVDPSRFRWRRRGRIIVSGAGPAMNIALAIVSLTAAAFWTMYGPRTEPLAGNVWAFLLTGGWINLALAAFNLLPIPPLDGASILMGISFRFYELFQRPHIEMISFFLIIVIFMSGLGAMLFGLAADVSHEYVSAILAILP